MTYRIAAVALAGALLATAPAGAVVLTYTGFASTAGLQVNGDAATATDTAGRSVLRLTPATIGQSGSAFSTQAVTLGAGYSFSTAFTFNINQSGNTGADGIVFAIQTVSNTAGGAGGGIGYEGIGRSIGVEFDTFQNFYDPNDNHVGIDAGGSVSSLATATPAFTMEDAGDVTAFIDYNGASQALEVRLSRNGLRPADALLSYTIDVAAQLGTRDAYVGFTSGTGAAFANHDIVNWQFRDDFSPITDPTAPPPTSDVPEPASWMAMTLGFGLLGGAMRARRRTLATA